jgi:hypothetical protein
MIGLTLGSRSSNVTRVAWRERELEANYNLDFDVHVLLPVVALGYPTLGKMSVYTPPEPPAIPEDFPPPAALTEEQTAMHAKVLEHFSKSEYTLPDAEKGELLEDEKFWLVRLPLPLCKMKSTLTQSVP